MSHSKLEDYVLLQDFKRNKEQQSAFGQSLVGLYALALDKIAQGDGHVRDKIVGDVELKKSIEAELGTMWTFFSNKIKIVLLSAADVAAGKNVEDKPVDGKKDAKKKK